MFSDARGIAVDGAGWNYVGDTRAVAFKSSTLTASSLINGVSEVERIDEKFTESERLTHQLLPLSAEGANIR
ncbi:MAG: hypothetical protein V7638_4483 [Acidobacteriota bacterium]|jgi:hypothetical protein